MRPPVLAHSYAWNSATTRQNVDLSAVLWGTGLEPAALERSDQDAEIWGVVFDLRESLFWIRWLMEDSG